MEYKARYRKKGANPFAPARPGNQILGDALFSITVDFPDSTPIKEVKRLAKEATPDGYEFIEVNPIKKKRRQ
ncbi:MAG: hypothetical protein WC514_01370 [Candidatus Paceibacterota bacterium]